MQSLLGKKVSIVSLGCVKNLVDSEKLVGGLLAHQAELTPDAKDADLVVVNTCGFIEEAKQESIDAILEMADLRSHENPDLKILVTGCLSQRYQDLKDNMPEIDGSVGIASFDRMSEVALELLEAGSINLKETPPQAFTADNQRFLLTPQHYAYLRLSDGCDQKCSFCAIPGIRGKLRSKPMEDLLAEAEVLVQGGVKELLLVAHDSTAYGRDLYGAYRLTELLTALADLAGLDWIRLHYAYPTTFKQDMIDTMASLDKVCPYIDIPLQHASNNMLAKMRRGITQEKSIDLLQRFRAAMPDVALRTTFITGFPGETDADFQELYDFVAEQKFDHAGCFVYSDEEDTGGYAMTPKVDSDTAEARRQKLMDLQAQVVAQSIEKRVGQTHVARVDEIRGDQAAARTVYQAPEADSVVLLPSDALVPGQEVNVKITGAAGFDWQGQVI